MECGQSGLSKASEIERWTGVGGTAKGSRVGGRANEEATPVNGPVSREESEVGLVQRREGGNRDDGRSQRLSPLLSRLVEWWARLLDDDDTCAASLVFM